MTIERPVDVEYETQQILSPFFETYCTQLPSNYNLPNLLVTQVGGTPSDRIDTVDITIDARAETDGEASELIRNALGVLRASAGKVIQRVTVNSIGSWGNDPVRPDLSMYSARVRVYTHPEKTEV